MTDEWHSAEIQAAALEKIGVALRQPKPLCALIDAIKKMSEEETLAVVNQIANVTQQALQNAQSRLQRAVDGEQNNVSVHCAECTFTGVASLWGGKCPVCGEKLLPDTV